MKKKPENKDTVNQPPATSANSAEPLEPKPSPEPNISTPPLKTGEPASLTSLRSGPAGESDIIDKICQIISAEDETLLQKLQADIEELRKSLKERGEYLDLLKLVKADFENYQKRIKREKECWEKYQNEGLLNELLPALENFDRSLTLKCETAEAKCLLEGVSLTQREILRILEKHGVTRIKSVGEKFNAALYEAVGMIESTEKPAGTILEEVRPGYMLFDRVLRAAQVKIATSPKSTDNQ